MIIVDSPRFRKGTKLFAHLGSTTSKMELHDFAKLIGLKKCWYQGSKFPHYDIQESMVPVAIKHGAIKITSKKFVTISIKQNKI